MTLTSRRIANNLGLVLCVALLALCVLAHLATFISPVSPAGGGESIIGMFVLTFAAGGCAYVVRRQPVVGQPILKSGALSVVLLVYAVLTFVYFYRTTGGATSVDVVDGHYVSEYQGQVMRIITESEYAMFPSLVTRIMSAWLATMAVSMLATFSAPVRQTQHGHHPG